MGYFCYTHHMDDFNYLPDDAVYLDSACQSLRPQPVIEALNNYYTNHNSCGERVKYRWGKITDEKVEATRSHILRHLGLKDKHYFVSFTLNTTYGINLILNQIDPSPYQKIITSDIEHNSPFLSTLAFANRYGVERLVISRNDDGSLPLDYDFDRAIVVVNCASNLDGRLLVNIKDLIRQVHRRGGIVIIDAAQAMAHHSHILFKTDADAICFSAHKMYAPSLGVMVVKRDLIPQIRTSFIGGGMVDDVDIDNYKLSSTSPQHAYTQFEPGLQAWGEIIATDAALTWLEKLPSRAHQDLEENYTRLFEFLSEQDRVYILNQSPSPTITFHIKNLDSHLVGEALSAENIMARTGYVCVHYYLDHLKHLPPMIRFSLGYHSRKSDIDKTIEILAKILG